LTGHYKQINFSGVQTQQKANEYWRQYKNNTEEVKSKMIELKSIANKNKRFRTIDEFKKSLNRRNSSTGLSSEINLEIINEGVVNDINEKNESLNQLSQKTTVITAVIESPEETDQRPVFNQKHTPAQDKAKQELDVVEEEILKLTRLKELGLEPNDYSKKIRVLSKQKRKIKEKLKSLLKSNERMKKYRSMRKKLEILNRKHPEVMKSYKLIEEKVGRPQIETGQEGLLETIIKIAINGGAAEGRRHPEMIRTCKTLDDLNECLKEKGISDRFKHELIINYSQGFKISRSATYLRLLPRRANSSEGKRHVLTVPVKLIKARNTERKKHKTHFATATINYLKDLAVTMGSGPIFF
jgi:hypothetical protein